MSDSDICNLMVSDAELEPGSHVRKDVLHGIVSNGNRTEWSPIHNGN